MQELEMVTCPICGKPFPKIRRDLGYKCCVNCSTEEAVSCIVEGSLEGDGDDTVHSSVIVVSKDQARSVENSRKQYLKCLSSEGETRYPSEDDEDTPEDVGLSEGSYEEEFEEEN